MVAQDADTVILKQHLIGVRIRRRLAPAGWTMLADIPEVGLTLRSARKDHDSHSRREVPLSRSQDDARSAYGIAAVAAVLGGSRGSLRACGSSPVGDNLA